MKMSYNVDGGRGRGSKNLSLPQPPSEAYSVKTPKSWLVSTIRIARKKTEKKKYGEKGLGKKDI